MQTSFLFFPPLIYYHCNSYLIQMINSKVISSSDGRRQQHVMMGRVDGLCNYLNILLLLWQLACWSCLEHTAQPEITNVSFLYGVQLSSLKPSLDHQQHGVIALSLPL